MSPCFIFQHCAALSNFHHQEVCAHHYCETIFSRNSPPSLPRPAPRIWQLIYTIPLPQCAEKAPFASFLLPVRRYCCTPTIRCHSRLSSLLAAMPLTVSMQTSPRAGLANRQACHTHYNCDAKGKPAGTGTGRDQLNQKE